MPVTTESPSDGGDAGSTKYHEPLAPKLIARWWTTTSAVNATFR